LYKKNWLHKQGTQGCWQILADQLTLSQPRGWGQIMPTK
jgi:hypothetical protein